MQIATFCFNPFCENTYIVYNEGGEAWIIDPGCMTHTEEATIVDFLESKGLRPVRMLLTHAHIDHILGCAFFGEQYGMLAEMHVREEALMQAAVGIAGMYGIPYRAAPWSKDYLYEGQELFLGQQRWTALWCPGHSPGSLCFYQKEESILIAGDVLFEGSIGRTDLPGGDHEALIRSIREKLFVLDNSTKVLPGHGGSTTIGREKMTNPFLQEV
ncbi:MAG: MBL fold metallo-hydrolase [Saprospiraceae bacterium]|nr:MBL fold metallo-hydrolase [Saprospiraceae bacterium]